MFVMADIFKIIQAEGIARVNCLHISKFVRTLTTKLEAALFRVPGHIRKPFC